MTTTAGSQHGHGAYGVCFAAPISVTLTVHPPGFPLLLKEGHMEPPWPGSVSLEGREYECLVGPTERGGLQWSR